MRRALGWAFAMIIAGVLAVGFYLTGGPAENRALRMDEARRRDLFALRSDIDVYAVQKGSPPPDLKTLAAAQESNGLYFETRWAQSFALDEFEYRVLDAAKRRYELCSHFLRPSPPAAPFLDKAVPDYPHPAGRACFEFTAPGPKS